MNLLQIVNGSVIFGNPALLDDVNFHIEKGQRICIVGRNGSGKSTFLKVLNSDITLDHGKLIKNDDVTVAMLPQDPPQQTQIRVFDYIAEGLEKNAALIKEFHALTNIVGEDASEKNLQKLQVLQEQLDTANAWSAEQRIHQLISQFGLEPEAYLSSLSGGWRRKAALAQAMVQTPDILLLDEPTNHLDIDTVKWLEETLIGLSTTLVFISHDRAFIRKLATKVVDIDRGNITEYNARYDEYLIRKQEVLAIEESHNKLFDKKLAQEETWIRQGIKARRTRNEGRVRALKNLREEFKARRNVQGTAIIKGNSAQSSGKKVFELDAIGYQINNQTIINDLTLLVNRGDKIGLIGPNGAGKSTLIKILLGELLPTAGNIKFGTQLETVYFDQHRQQLDLNKTVVDTVADGKQEITVNGNTQHVMSYLQDYLFTPDRARVPVSALSGGEKNRLMLAKLLVKPNNLLVLDEPTNDLDVETLELLESLLVEYKGTLILASHDRDFLDNVVTSCLSFEKNAIIRQFVGGYSDLFAWYEQQAKLKIANSDTPVGSGTATGKSNQGKLPKPNKKLSYKEERELTQLPSAIEELEATISTLQEYINKAGFFEQPKEQSQKVLSELAQAEQDLEVAFDRWQILEEKQNSLKLQDY